VFFFAWLLRTLDVEKSVINVKRTAEEIEAGISTFDELKQFNVLYALAKTYSITPDEAFNLDYSTAFLTLVRQSKEAVFQKKLQEVMRRKHENQ
jgi:hypothetical protein